MADTMELDSSGERVWDGSDFEAALAHLDKLQEQIDLLRDLLPSLVAPLEQPGLSKANLFLKIKSAALQSQSDLKSFRETWTSEQTQSLFSRSRESLQQDADLSKASKVARYGWDEKA